jgi:hypothetical protein
MTCYVLSGLVYNINGYFLIACCFTKENKLTTLISFISLFISSFLVVKQFKLSKRVDQFNKVKFIASKLDEHKKNFFDIHQDTFGILNKNNIEFSMTTSSIGSFFDIFDARDRLLSRRPLRHIYYKVCELIAASFYTEIQRQSMENLSERLHRLTNLLPDLDFNDKTIIIKENDLLRFLKNRQGADYELPKIKCFRELYQELYNSINSSDYFELAKKIQKRIDPTYSAIKNNFNRFNELTQELSKLELMNKLEEVEMASNQMLYWNIQQTHNLLRWLSDGFYICEISEYSMDTYRKGIWSVMPYAISVGARFLLINYLSWRCSDLDCFPVNA